MKGPSIPDELAEEFIKSIQDSFHIRIYGVPMIGKIIFDIV